MADQPFLVSGWPSGPTVPDDFMTELDELAFKIYCAMIATGGNVSGGENLGENQAKVAYLLAETFMKVRHARTKS